MRKMRQFKLYKVKNLVTDETFELQSDNFIAQVHEDINNRESPGTRGRNPFLTGDRMLSCNVVLGL